MSAPVGQLLFRYVPGVGKVGVALTGPTGSTGSTGPTGPTGVTSIPSAFATSGQTVTLTTGPTGTNIADTSITTTQTGYIWSTTSVELKNLDNSLAHDVTLYQIVNGFTSDGMTISIAKRSNNGTYQVVTMSSRSSSQVGPGTWPIQVYAYTADTTSNVTAIHRDTFAVGHLS